VPARNARAWCCSSVKEEAIRIQLKFFNLGLALLIWLHGGKRLGIPALCLATLAGLVRVPMGIHFLSDILCGAALGVSMVLASQKLAIPRFAFQILKLQRKSPVAFCAVMFVATYSLATFGADLRELAKVIAH
jgi:hypothetical protein